MRDFWFLLLPFFICGATTTGLMDTHLIPYAHDHGFTPGVTGLAVGVLAAFNILGTLVSGVLADRLNNARMLGFLYLGRAASLAVLVFAGDPATLVVFAALFGLMDFATLAPTQLLATKLFRGGTGAVFGYLFMSHQLGSAVGSFVPGLIFDLTGGYLTSLSGAMTLLLIASVLSSPSAGGVRQRGSSQPCGPREESAWITCTTTRSVGSSQQRARPLG